MYQVKHKLSFMDSICVPQYRKIYKKAIVQLYALSGSQ